MKTPEPDVQLSSGRVIAHRREPNGSQTAIPTTGSYAMTEAECREYSSIRCRRAKAEGCVTTFVDYGTASNL